MTEIAIIGAGMAGFGAAYAIHQRGLKHLIYEQNDYHGGHAATFVKDGFVFDDGPHISFTKDERLQALFSKSVNDRFEMIRAGANNYWKGIWIKHPAQRNLYGLPTDLVVDILADYIERDTHLEIKNYKDWLYASFGKLFAETFPMRYGLKFHTSKAANMSTEWVGPRLYQPDLKEILHGALSPSTPDVHYVDHFRYPTQGGFVSFLDGFLDATAIKLNHRIVEIDGVNNILYFADGKHAHYDALISTAPLPELIPMIQNVPDTIRQAADRLACTCCVLVNIGIDRSDISDAQWTYFYDDDIIFTRLSYPHMLSPQNAPPESGSIQAEIYFSKKYKPLDINPDDCIPRVTSDLKRCGLLTPGDTIRYAEAREVPYANIIFDLDRESALGMVHNYLDENGIGYAGRYGEWGYHWTDESFLSGEKAARRVLEQMNL
ncbi:O-antigen synthesis protein WbyH [Desulfosarcina ovata subsp. sediminis]|uniref:O-antigen synthesis protein WbyH n=1 Tax=Desulfosarcina ovata subsp. sediminis TaxID=885957 RepID=A0A5K7ZN78_9BACT|nr:FAD-dependent oxidoreductase [Desulfosarcina ovata]BBO82786.1 O-antigen synthesis protein WbyH [Desulfosarcina ovata subsp. sediminis]